MGKFRPFRIWYYLRVGYQFYFAFIFATINMMTVTYFLAIENAPFLKQVFPSFTYYVIFLIIVGVPILILTGLSHFKKMPAFKSEIEVAYESNPFIYRAQPGHMLHVTFPFQLWMSKILLKIANNEKLSDEDLKEIEDLQKKLETLSKGGFVGLKEGKKYPFRKPNK